MNQLNRRDMLRGTAIGTAGLSVSGWLPAMAEGISNAPQRKRHCILLWMNGGASQLDTFDLKPDHKNGGEFKEIATSVPGLRISEHLPKIAAHGEHLAVVRGVSTKEGDHRRGTFAMRTGHSPGGPISYPSIGASLSKALAEEQVALPSYVSIAPNQNFNQQAFGPGFLGPSHAPLTVGTASGANQTPPPNDGFAELGVDDLENAKGVNREQAEARLDIWRFMQNEFLEKRRAKTTVAHHTVFENAVRMMHSDASNAFDLSQEPEPLRAAYGRGRFGQGCLMARRLVETGVPFVEVSLGGLGGANWDTHRDNFSRVQSLSAELDAGWGTLMSDLSDRGLLESTTILWMGEFGRTPQIFPGAGRNHFPAAWSCVFAGGGIQGGGAYGKTSPDGMSVVENKVSEGDVLATLSQALGVDPETENLSPGGRPFKIAEGNPITKILS